MQIFVKSLPNFEDEFFDKVFSSASCVSSENFEVGNFSFENEIKFLFKCFGFCAKTFLFFLRKKPRSLSKLHRRVQKNVLGKNDDFCKGCNFSGSLFEFFWTFDDFFATCLSKQHSKCPEKNVERKLFGKLFLNKFRFFEIFPAGCSELHLACPGDYFEKNVPWLGN